MTTAPTTPDIESPRPCPHCRRTSRPGQASGWHKRIGPAPVLRKALDLDPWRLPAWVDHPYRVRSEYDGQWLWVAEPYDLDASDLNDLILLGRHGFRVSISAWPAMHYPGRTLAVVIRHETRN